MDTQTNALDELAAALNDHQITDDKGAMTEEQQTPVEETAASEQKTTVTEPTTAEKSVETEATVSQTEEDDSETQPVEDETGKRYVPEKRFKEVYGKLKEKERLLQEKEAQALITKSQTSTVTEPTTPKIDETTAISIELLKGKYPQFDPESEDYSPELDQLGAKILAATPGMTRIDAAREALKIAKNLTSKVEMEKTEAKLVKTIQSDQGITSRVLNRQSEKVDPANLSLEEKEKWLKENGQW